MTDRTGRDDERRALILAVEDDVGALRMLERELRRYDADYAVVIERSPDRALAALEAARKRRAGGRPGARRSGDARARRDRAARPRPAAAPGGEARAARRLGRLGAPRTGRGMVSGMAASLFDYYVLKPQRRGEEQFHRIVSEFLHEWARLRSQAESEITLVGEEWSPRTHELKSVLTRSGVPHVVRRFRLRHGPRAARRRRLLAGRRAGGVRPRRADPDQPEQARARGGIRSRDRARRGTGVRSRRGRGRARRPRRRRRCGLGGAEHAGRRARGRRRPGGLELADSQLPRLLAGSAAASSPSAAYQQAWVFGATFLIMREVTGLRRAEGGCGSRSPAADIERSAWCSPRARRTAASRSWRSSR